MPSKIRPIAALLCSTCLAGCPAPPATPAAGGPVTYDMVATQVFSNCTTRSCHGQEGKRGGLQLTADVAYDQLVGVAAANQAAAAKGKLRVKPGDPAASFVIQKLEGPAADEGSAMPPLGTKLPAETIDLLRRWIAAGCPR